uniref:Nucleoprotein n=1 Tax=Lobos virus TaxID=3139875 RepID=A0AAN0N739_9VIRU
MGTREKALFRIRQGAKGKKVVLITPPLAQPKVYPSAYFEKNQHTKPKVHLPKNTLTVAELQASLTDGIALSRARVEHAVLLLHHFGKTLKGKLTETWTSFGVEIGQAGEEITPWDLIDIVFSDTEPPAPSAYAGAVTSEVGLFGFILFLYRALSVRDRGTAQYRTSIHAKLAQLLSAAPFSVAKADFSSAGTAYVAWASDAAYLAMVAAIDMFLYRFPGDTHATVRIGTMPSRYKDCAVFTSLGQILSLTGMEVLDLFRWMFLEGVADEASSLMGVGEEMDQEYSYSAYLSDLKLVPKSPYSAVANPLMHQWLHTIGSLLLSERSLNARHLSDNSFQQILANAAMIAFVRHRSTGFKMMFASTQEQADEEGEQGVQTLGGLDLEGVPRSASAVDWFAWLDGKDCVIPFGIYNFLHRAISNMSGLRDGSVGKKVKQALEAYAVSTSLQ